MLQQVAQQAAQQAAQKVAQLLQQHQTLPIADPLLTPSPSMHLSWAPGVSARLDTCHVPVMIS